MRKDLTVKAQKVPGLQESSQAAEPASFPLGEGFVRDCKSFGQYFVPSASQVYLKSFVSWSRRAEDPGQVWRRGLLIF